jgi:DNA repair protein RadC
MDVTSPVAPAPLLGSGPLPGPRERAIERGVGALSDAELLAMLLGTGGAGAPVSVVATRLLASSGGLLGLAGLGPGGLADLPGLGPAKAARVAAAMELGRRTRRTEPSPTSFRNAEDVAKWLAARIGDLEHEELWLLAIDGRNRLRGARRVGQGGVHGCAITPRDVFRAALAEGATAILLGHNHPGGVARPSQEDIRTTSHLREVGELVGVPLLDHVIVAPGGAFASLLDLGLLA